jgi:LysR family transcriptional regulator, regulator for genes of the gallate degradation pathway
VDIRQLSHFLAVVETGSLNRASALANVSQQGMSASIKALEQSLNTILLERGPAGATPTVAGAALAEHARLILGQMRLAKAEIASIEAAETGLASVGVGPFFAQRIIPQAILELTARRPGMCVRAIEGTTQEIVRLLLEGQVDFGLSTPSLQWDLHPDIDGQLLFEDTDVPLVCANHPLLAAATPRLQDLAAYPWVFSSRFKDERERVTKIFVEAGADPPHRMVLTDSISILRELMRDGHFIHVSGAHQLGTCFPDMRIVPIALPHFTRRRIGLLTTRRSGSLPPASRLLMTHVLDVWKKSEQREALSTKLA